MNAESFVIVNVVDLGTFKSNVFLVDVKEGGGVRNSFLLRTAKNRDSTDWILMIKEGIETVEKQRNKSIGSIPQKQ